ncbi:caspase family protein [Coleofasciculus sp. C1-SOL-03]|uniref:caspase family protein n=1 Tax=Coleofasciculus sp. C1-SOL-03 TaxID=3069522 RepID=UPI00406311F6
MIYPPDPRRAMARLYILPLLLADMKFSVKPERTYGLVVGIEKYHENSWNVDGQVNDALKFAQWLSARGVPRDNIRLCLSSLDENGTLAEPTEWVIEEATESNITTLITDVLSDKKGDLLYLFWAGHGLITSTRNRRLLCADATKRNWQNLDLDSLLVYLSSDSFKISHHICIIDACANYLLRRG